MEQTARLEQILTYWDIQPVADWHVIQQNIARITSVDGRHFVLKDLGDDNEWAIRRLQFEYEVLHHVEQTGFAVARPLLSSQGTPYVVDDGHLYRLSHWLPNRPADVQTSQEQGRLYANYGMAIGRFHQALATYQDDDLSSKTWQTDLRTRVLDEAVPVVLAHLDRAQLPLFQRALAEIKPQMASTLADLPVQLIVWDCHPGNVAVDGLEVSGFIDCDHLSIAPRIFDLANFLVHLIKWNMGDAEAEVAWLAQFRQLLSGYESFTPLTGREREALFYAMAGIPLLFMDFFFQGGHPDLTKVELALFRWLVRYRQEILPRLEKP